MIYYIYHIPEKQKIGVTINVKRRMIEHKWYGSYEILETHEDGWIAGNREKELQAEYGYQVDDVHYMITRQNGLNNNKQKSIQHIEKIRSSNKGKLRTAETRARMSASFKGVPKKSKSKCPHCNKEGETSSMMRWHFNNCKQKNN